MQKITFKNLPDTTTPVNATNLNAIQTNAENAINLKADITKENLSMNDYSTFASLVSAIFQNKNKICYGQIGDLHNTNIKTLIGNPNIGNYTTAVFEVLIDFGSAEGSIRATAFAPFTTNVVVGYINVSSGGSDCQWTGWTH